MPTSTCRSITKYEPKKTFSCLFHPLPWLDESENIPFSLCPKSSKTISDVSKYVMGGKLCDINLSRKQINLLERKQLAADKHNEDVEEMYEILLVSQAERRKLMKASAMKKRSRKQNFYTKSRYMYTTANVDVNRSKYEDDPRERVSEHKCQSHDRSVTKQDADTGCKASENSNTKITRDSASASQSTRDDVKKDTALADLYAHGISNEKHCKVVADLVEQRLFASKPTRRHNAEEVRVKLYVQTSRATGRRRNKAIQHTQMEMAHLCLKTFFFPGTKLATATCVDDILQTILMTVTSYGGKGSVCDVFSQEIKLESGSNIKAVLFMTNAAVAALKHREVCMLDTLAVILGLEKQDMLCLNMDVKPRELL